MRGSPAPESAGHELMIAGAVLSVVPLLLLFLVLKRC
jgi:ABC-type glycerol-3-phosphate transport system permease component